MEVVDRRLGALGDVGRPRLGGEHRVPRAAHGRQARDGVGARLRVGPCQQEAGHGVDRLPLAGGPSARTSTTLADGEPDDVARDDRGQRRPARVAGHAAREAVAGGLVEQRPADAHGRLAAAATFRDVEAADVPHEALGFGKAGERRAGLRVDRVDRRGTEDRGDQHRALAARRERLRGRQPAVRDGRRHEAEAGIPHRARLERGAVRPRHGVDRELLAAAARARRCSRRPAARRGRSARRP